MAGRASTCSCTTALLGPQVTNAEVQSFGGWLLAGLSSLSHASGCCKTLVRSRDPLPASVFQF